MGFGSDDLVDKILSDDRAMQILNEQTRRKQREDESIQPEEEAKPVEPESAVSEPENVETPAEPEAEPEASTPLPEPEPEPVVQETPAPVEPTLAVAEEIGAPEADEVAEPELEPEPETTTGDLESAMAEVEPSGGLLAVGDIIQGTVMAVSHEGVLVDVGTKTEGTIPAREFVGEAAKPAVGDVLDVYVVRPEDEDGNVLLSKKRADYENVWHRILSAHESGEIITAMVTERVKGGLRVDLGIQGFVPASHVGARRLRDIDSFVGRSLRLKIIEADRESKKVILSHRIVIDEERQARKDETLTAIEEGQVVSGRVRSIANYGAFVDIGGVDGLLHVSEMAWTRIKHPSEVVNVGDTIQVMVLRIDRDKERISLGRRQILPDPWKEAEKLYRPGQIVPVKITRVVPFGAFAAVDASIEGIIPTSELSERRISDPGDIVQVGQELEVKILNIRAQERRMTLSLVEASAQREREEYREYMQSQGPPALTLGDLFGEQLRGAAGESEADAPEPSAAPPADETPPAEVEPDASWWPADLPDAPEEQ